MTPSKTEVLRAKITRYLSTGGLFNPELADHDEVRNLLMECRDALPEDPKCSDWGWCPLHKVVHYEY